MLNSVNIESLTNYFLAVLKRSELGSVYAGKPVLMGAKARFPERGSIVYVIG